MIHLEIIPDTSSPCHKFPGPQTSQRTSCFYRSDLVGLHMVSSFDPLYQSIPTFASSLCCHRKPLAMNDETSQRPNHESNQQVCTRTTGPGHSHQVHAQHINPLDISLQRPLTLQSPKIKSPNGDHFRVHTFWLSDSFISNCICLSWRWILRNKSPAGAFPY